MSRLRIFDQGKPDAPRVVTSDHAEITRELGARGIRFEQWQANVALEPGAGQDQVIAAYQGDIERLKREKDYQAVDVISLNADHPDKATLRQKFLNEHTHSEDEVRFFVAGSGLFTLHLGDDVCEVLCEQGDLIAVPDGTRHWFDMGPNPHFIAIRMFTNPAGWVANFTGDPIASTFPRLDN